MPFTCWYSGNSNDIERYDDNMMINLAVVLLRGCWLDGTNKCLKNGAAEVTFSARGSEGRHELKKFMPNFFGPFFIM